MRIRSVILLLMGILFAIPISAQEKDRGYWALMYGKTFLIGDRSKTDETGIISGQDGKAEFRVLHRKASVFIPNGDYSVYQKDDGTVVINEEGEHTKEVRNSYRLTATWTKPQKYVKVGEENKIFIDVKTMLDDEPFSSEKLSSDLDSTYSKFTNFREDLSVDILVAVMPEISTDKTSFGYEAMKAILDACDTPDEIETRMERFIENAGEDSEALEEAFAQVYGSKKNHPSWKEGLTNKAEGRLENTDEWSHQLALGGGSYMIVAVGATFKSKATLNFAKTGADSYSVVHYYLYKYYPNGGDLEVVNRADDPDVWKAESDEDEGTLLPPWVIPVGVLTIGGVVGYEIFKRRRKKEEDTEGDDPDDSDEPKKPSAFKMILYKDFNDKLMVGDDPKVVGARIEEITADGKQIERPDLTAQIEILEGNNIKMVGKAGMMGKYRAASIKVEQFPKEEPYEGDITFVFRAPGGALKNKLVVNIEDGHIKFFQPNLTLPTDYQKVARLPFKVIGASDKAKVNVRIDSNEYKAEAVKGGAQEERGIWYARISENHSVVPPKKDRKTGEYTISHLQVEVTDVNGHVIEGSLPVLRYNMGLVFRTDPFVGCYAEHYDPDKHPFKTTYHGRQVSTAVTEATYFLMTWDEKEHRLRRVVPVDEKSIFTVLPLPEEADKSDDATDYLSKETRGLTDQEVIDKVGLQFYVKDILDDGSSVCCIYARGVLDAPARRKVRLHMECVYKGEKYEAEQDVWLTSMPARHFESEADEREASRLDDQMTDNLAHICNFIVGHNILDRIGPVYRLAQLQLDGYDPRFGYDMEMCELIRETFLRYVRGETLGANAKPEGVEYLGIAAEILVALSKTNKQIESWLEDHGGIWTRVAIGVATLGWSEPFMLYVRAADKMVGVANHPINPGGFLETFYVGAVEVVEYYAVEQLWTADMELGGEMIAHYRPELAENVSRFVGEVAGNVQKKLGIFGKDVRVIAKDMKNFVTDRVGQQMKNRLSAAKALNDKAARSAEDIIMKHRKTAKWTPEEILEDEMVRAANTAAIKEIKEMEHACLDYIHYRTPETKEAFRQFCYKMQSNKIAQKQLSMYKSDWANNVRSEYYRLLQEDYRLIDKEALKDACAKLRERGVNVNEDDLFVFCATNSDSTSLHWGDAITRDRDLSMMYKNKPTKVNPHPLPSEVPQEIAEESYGKAYKKHTGMTMQEGDQAVVQKGSKEMIGCGKADLNRGFKKEHFGEAFEDLDGVATAFEHKPAEWIEQGARLRAAGDIAGAVAKEEEGLRQAIKLYFNSMEKRAIYRGTISRIKPKELELFKVMKRLEIKTQDSFSLSVTAFKKILKSEYNMDITDVPKLMKELVYRLEA